MGGRRGRAIRALLGLVIAGVSLYLAFRNVEWSRAIAAMSEIRPGMGLLAVALVGANVLGRAALWRRLASRLGPATLGLAVRAILVGMLANNVLPARLGELARSGLWALRTGIGQGRALGVLAAERSLDLVALGLFALFVLPTAPVSDDVRRALAIGAGVGVALVVVFVVVARVREHVAKLGALGRLVGRISEGFASLGGPREIAVPILLSAFVWVMTYAYMVASLEAFGIHVSLRAAALLLVATQLAVTLPSAPSFAGPYHLAVSLALLAYGIDRDRAAGFAIFNHLGWVLPTSLAGGVALFREGLSLGSLVEPSSYSSPSASASASASADHSS